MANKRILKKQIRYACGDMAAEAILARQYLPGIDPEKATAIIVKIAALQQAALENVTFAFDKDAKSFDSAKAYKDARSKYFKYAYKTLRDDFNKAAKDIVKEMNTLLSPEMREAAKEAVAK